jgi:hypothetical protein
MIWHHYIFCQIQIPLFQDMKPVRLIYWFNKYQTTTLVGINFDSSMPKLAKLISKTSKVESTNLALGVQDEPAKLLPEANKAIFRGCSKSPQSFLEWAQGWFG